MTNSTTFRTLPKDLQTGLWLDGANVPAQDGGTFDVINPATEEVLTSVADAQSADWMKALDLADQAFADFAAMSPRQRSAILYDIFEAVKEREDDFARVMTLEMGKPLAEARGEVAYGASYFQWFAEEAVRAGGRTAQSPAGQGSIVTVRKPVGPVLAITPWNFPLAMAARKIAPALAVGCPVIVKPAGQTPLTMLLLGSVMAEVLERHDAPASAIAIITSSSSKDLSSELMADPRLKKVTFTGSTGVGQVLVKQSAEHLQRTSMELGGNAPFVVAEDADLDLTIEAAVAAKMRNGGEACISANRFLVAESIAQEFTERLVAKMREFVLGDGLDEGVTLGPLINAEQRDGVAELVDDARRAGASVLVGGEVPDRSGYFYPATVVVDVPKGTRILEEEIFGPVATVVTFKDLDEGIALANDTPFGLAAYGFTTNVATAQRFAEELQAGMVGVNRAGISDAAAPFGGIGLSGFGREGGLEGLDEYTYIKYVALPA
ncbi:NAD-dependent succinate-semialdehyde dehydrogenase [Corynebacterium sp. 319]|uniref:NAD-dependent succinate-semialdehyde dehydrogenase n=1 Tax=unclassified Corynebacterium TaxID=2624378 RepID=UPI00125CC67E|nr:MULTISPECIES: NAD-dependent succinate-semialdehyde dehydrogenase [unclassified Corynebacterium]KAB1553471.1 NAD-dependent succinate-semialdehyde dehydrogenase [Corynebacterium sp. 319]KAB3540785.1 NAD-dependent succinate-semialdehyde dehydrogenase [Corynebacterium sp. 366]